jgi:sigma-B regulation protein RsbU (phosphoserine phosphatase)
MVGPKLSEAEKLKKKIANVKLHSLLEITKAINDNYSTDKLFSIYLNILSKELNIGKVALFTNERGVWNCVLKYGIVADFSDISIERDLLSYKEITGVNLIPTSSYSIESFDIIIPVFHKTHALAYLLVGDLDENRVEMSPTLKHLPFVQTLTNIIIVAIENKRLARENLMQVASRKELELASEMQAMLFPSILPNDEKLMISAYYQPHHQVGGDYYDYIRLNENEVAFCVADVSGKGVSAALLMANFQANLRALFKGNSSLREIIHELNTLVYGNAKGEKFITLFIAKYNLVTRILTYVNAGHNPSLLVHNGSVFSLTTGSIGLGMLHEIPKVREGVIHLSKGDFIFSYTDGLVEQCNESGDEYGMDRLIHSLLEKGEDTKMKDLNTTIIGSLDKFRQDVPYIDDIALFSCKFH